MRAKSLVRVFNTFLFFGIAMYMLMPCMAYADQDELQITVAEVKDNRPAIYTLISDDGFYDGGVILNNLAKELDMRVTVAGVSSFLMDNLEQWEEIASQGYVEVLPHSYSHRKMADTETVLDDDYYREIYESRVFTEEMFGKPIIAFVCPNNEMTERGYTFLENAGYYAVRRGTRGLNSLNPEEGTEPFQWFNLCCYGIGDKESTQERNMWVDEAIENRRWLIEMWHSISPDGDVGYQPISTDMAYEHMLYVTQQRDEGNVWIASYQEAVRYLREKQSVKIDVEQKNGMEAIVKLTCDRKKLPIDLFDDPLTLNVSVPENWNYVFAFQNGRALEVKWLDDGVISFNAIPNGDEILIRAIE